MEQKSVNILGIETSCDETAAAIVADGREVRSSVVASQTKLHEKYGGVVPEIASRAHIEKIYPVITEALERAGVGKEADRRGRRGQSARPDHRPGRGRYGGQDPELHVG